MTDTSPAALRALADELSGISGSFTTRAASVKQTLTSAEATLRALSAEKEAGAPTPAQGPLIEVGETSRGYKLYRAPNPVGGNTYWSDEIGGGVVVWDTCLVGEETLRLALAIEDADGWIPWEGGECPAPEYTRVEVRLRDGEEYANWSHNFSWGHVDAQNDIVAYRVIEEPRP